MVVVRVRGFAIIVGSWGGHDVHGRKQKPFSSRVRAWGLCDILYLYGTRISPTR
jgi:hypothetical protein